MDGSAVGTVVSSGGSFSYGGGAVVNGTTLLPGAASSLSAGAIVSGVASAASF